MDFGKILTRSWEIIWKHKVLWVFGIFASCAQGGGGGGGGQGFNYSTDSVQTGDLPPQLQRFFLQIERYFQTTPEETFIPIVFAAICAFILLGLFFWVLSIYGRAGLIHGAFRAESGGTLTFSALSSASIAVLLRAIGLNFLLGLIPLAVGLLFAFLAVTAGLFTFGIGFLCLIPLICLLIPLGFAYAVFIQMANIALIGENLGVMDAITRGWEIFRNNLGNLIVMALILLVGGFIVSVIISLPVIIVFAPVVIGIFSGEEAFGRGLLISAICLVLALPVIMLANGILQSYIQTAWSLTYMRISGKKLKAKAS
ncbi:MAG: hypothetical protein ACRDFQ_06615 [Anaerolineales bacterium]